jgi:hypothetical protein
VPVGGTTEAQLAAEAGQLDEVREHHRRVVLDRLDAGVLFPVEALAFDAIGDSVARGGRGFTGLLNVAVVDLPLHLAIVLVAAEPHLDGGRETGVLLDGDDVAALRAGDEMREERDTFERERAVARLHRSSVGLGERQTIVATEPVAQHWAVVEDDLQRRAGEDVRQWRCADRSVHRRERAGDLLGGELRVLDAMHLLFGISNRHVIAS